MDKLNVFFNKNYTYAVIGASNNPKKYSYSIVKALIDANIKVIPINPKEKLVLGLKSYSSLKDVVEKIDVVNFLVPPNISIKILYDIKDLNILKVWFQLASVDFKCEKYCKYNKIQILKGFDLLEVIKKFKK